MKEGNFVLVLDNPQERGQGRTGCGLAVLELFRKPRGLAGRISACRLAGSAGCSLAVTSMEKAGAITAMKGARRVAALTAFDFPTAQMLDGLGIPLILVGDSLGMVALGYPDTTHVTMADMEHHVRAVARAKPNALLAADLPFHSYDTAGSAVANSLRLVQAGAEAVKAEGGRAIIEQVRAIIREGIPVLGHIGMLPQHVREEGGYHVKGKSDAEREALLADAMALAQAGAFAIVLELVAASVAREITQGVSVPTIGIGSGSDCDGEILVTTDKIGMSPGYIPKHARARMDVAAQVRGALRDWKSEVEAARAISA